MPECFARKPEVYVNSNEQTDREWLKEAHMRRRSHYLDMMAFALVVFMSGCNRSDDNGLRLPSVIPPGSSQSPVSLGSINSGGNDFAVLAHTTVTNTGLTSVTGDIGVWP